MWDRPALFLSAGSVLTVLHSAQRKLHTPKRLLFHARQTGQTRKQDAGTYVTYVLACPRIKNKGCRSFTRFPGIFILHTVTSSLPSSSSSTSFVSRSAAGLSFEGCVCVSFFVCLFVPWLGRQSTCFRASLSLHRIAFFVCLTCSFFVSITVLVVLSCFCVCVKQRTRECLLYCLTRPCFVLLS